MTQQELDGNKILSNYIGIRFHENGTVSNFPSIFNLKMGESTINDFRFHCSWEYIMHVYHHIGYIASTPFSVNSDRDKQNFRDMASMWKHINHCLIYEDKETLEKHVYRFYEMILAFVKWYNENIMK